MTTYLIADRQRGLVKIGKTSDVAARLHELRTASADDLVLIDTIPIDVESYLHHACHRRHVAREWFDDRDGVVTAAFAQAKRRALQGVTREGFVNVRALRWVAGAVLWVALASCLVAGAWGPAAAFALLLVALWRTRPPAAAPLAPVALSDHDLRRAVIDPQDVVPSHTSRR